MPKWLVVAVMPSAFNSTHIMKFTKSKIISLKVILLFTVAIFSTFIGDYFHSFFNDWKCTGSGQKIMDTYLYQKCNYAAREYHESTWHWGYRHWLYFFMCLTLFIIQIVDVVNYASSSEH